VPPAAPAPAADDDRRSGGAGRAAHLRAMAALVAVLAGLLVVLLLGLVTVFLLAFRTVSDVAALVAVTASAFGIVSAVVAAYVGLKLGTDQASEATRAHEAAEAKANVFALHVPEIHAADVARAALDAAAEARGRTPPAE
jgi:hypothetical protein